LQLFYAYHLMSISWQSVSLYRILRSRKPFTSCTIIFQEHIITCRMARTWKTYTSLTFKAMTQLPLYIFPKLIDVTAKNKYYQSLAYVMRYIYSHWLIHIVSVNLVDTDATARRHIYHMKTKLYTILTSNYRAYCQMWDIV